MCFLLLLSFSYEDYVEKFRNYLKLNEEQKRKIMDMYHITLESPVPMLPEHAEACLSTHKIIC